MGFFDRISSGLHRSRDKFKEQMNILLDRGPDVDFLLQFVVEKEKSTPLKRIEHHGKQAVNLRQRRCGSPVR